MIHPYLFTIKELALFLRTSEKNINNQIYRGEEGIKIPFGFKIGSKRLWKSETVFQWIEELERANRKQSEPDPDFESRQTSHPKKVGIRRV